MAATVNKGYTQCVGGIDKPHANKDDNALMTLLAKAHV